MLDFIGPDSSRGRKAMIAAGQQNQAFNFAAVLYFNQGIENTGWLNEDMVASAAASIPGFKVGKLLTERNSSATRDDSRRLRRVRGGEQGDRDAHASRGTRRIGARRSFRSRRRQTRRHSSPRSTPHSRPNARSYSPAGNL